MPDDFKEPLACVWRDNVDVDLEETEAEAPPFEPEKEKKWHEQKNYLLHTSNLSKIIPKFSKFEIRQMSLCSRNKLSSWADTKKNRKSTKEIKKNKKILWFLKLYIYILLLFFLGIF